MSNSSSFLPVHNPPQILRKFAQVLRLSPKKFAQVLRFTGKSSLKCYALQVNISLFFIKIKHIRNSPPLPIIITYRYPPIRPYAGAGAHARETPAPHHLLITYSCRQPAICSLCITSSHSARSTTKGKRGMPPLTPEGIQ